MTSYSLNSHSFYKVDPAQITHQLRKLVPYRPHTRRLKDTLGPRFQLDFMFIASEATLLQLATPLQSFPIRNKRTSNIKVTNESKYYNPGTKIQQQVFAPQPLTAQVLMPISSTHTKPEQLHYYCDCSKKLHLSA